MHGKGQGSLHIPYHPPEDAGLAGLADLAVERLVVGVLPGSGARGRGESLEAHFRAQAGRQAFHAHVMGAELVRGHPEGGWGERGGWLEVASASPVDDRKRAFARRSGCRNTTK